MLSEIGKGSTVTKQKLFLKTLHLSFKIHTIMKHMSSL